MADFSANTWKEQDSANTAPSPNGFPTGAAPSTLHPSLRNLVGASVRAWRRINGWYTTTGTATALVVTPEQAISAYEKGRWAIFPNATNTGAMTINISSLGAKSILRIDGTALVAGDVANGQLLELYYDGSAFRILNGAGAKFTGNVTASSFTGGTFAGNGAALTTLNASALASGTIPNAVIAGSYDGMDMLTANRIRLLATNDASNVSTAHAFQVGADSGTNLIIDNNEIIVRTAGVGATLYVPFGLGVDETSKVVRNNVEYWHPLNDGPGTGLDADTVDGYQAARLFRDDASFSTTGNLTMSNSAPEIVMTDTTAGSYNTKMAVNANNVYFQKQADGVTTWTTFMQFEMDTTNAYINGAQVLTNDNFTTNYLNGRIGYVPANSTNSIVAGNGMSGGGTYAASRTLTLGTPSTITNATTNSVSTTSHTHEISLSSGDINGFLGYTAANAANSIVAGNGMSGGGTIGASRTLTLGTPGGITGSTTNSVSTTSHTHAITLNTADIEGFLNYVPARNTTSVAAGDGLTGGGTLGANRTITMGTPSSITNSTGNSVTGTSHTHALSFTAAEVSGSSSNTETNLPIGSLVAVSTGGQVNRRSLSNVYIDSDNSYNYTIKTGGAQLAGGWRSCGRTSSDIYLYQRTS